MRIYDSAVKTGNDALDVLLGGYGLRCEAEKVELQCMIDGAALSALAVSDLYALFGNLLDNALEYLASLAEGDKKFIRLSSLRRGGYYILVAENYFEGELPLDKDSSPSRIRRTSRTTASASAASSTSPKNMAALPTWRRTAACSPCAAPFRRIACRKIEFRFCCFARAVSRGLFSVYFLKKK